MRNQTGDIELVQTPQVLAVAQREAQQEREVVARWMVLATLEAERLERSTSAATAKVDGGSGIPARQNGTGRIEIRCGAPEGALDVVAVRGACDTVLVEDSSAEDNARIADVHRRSGDEFLNFALGLSAKGAPQMCRIACHLQSSIDQRPNVEVRRVRATNAADAQSPGCAGSGATDSRTAPGALCCFSRNIPDRLAIKRWGPHNGRKRPGAGAVMRPEQDMRLTFAVAAAGRWASLYK
jgi:hypothetical protein